MSTSKKKNHRVVLALFFGGGVVLFSCYVLFMDLNFDLTFKCFNLYKEYILIYHPHWGTGTVTLAFSFLEDVI